MLCEKPPRLAAGFNPCCVATAPLSGAVSAWTNPGLSGAEGGSTSITTGAHTLGPVPSEPRQAQKTCCLAAAACLSATNPGAAACELSIQVGAAAPDPVRRCFLLCDCTVGCFASLEVPPSGVLPLHPACQSSGPCEARPEVVALQRGGAALQRARGAQALDFDRTVLKRLESPTRSARANACACRRWALVRDLRGNCERL